MKTLPFVLSILAFIVMTSEPAWAQGTTYYSQSSGDLNSFNSWNSQRDGSGEPPITFSGNTFVVQSGHSLTASASFTAHTLTVEPEGIVDAGANAVSLTDFNLQSRSEFRRGGTATGTPGTNRNLSATSTFVFNGTQTTISGNFSFGNLTWSAGNATPGGNLTIHGDLRITANQLRGSTGTTTPTRTHFTAGNIIVDGGTAVLVGTNATAAGTGTWIVGGNVITQNGGTLRGLNTGSTADAVVRIGGNLLNNGNVEKGPGTGNFTITFNGASHQTISGNAIVSADHLLLENADGLTLSTAITIGRTLTLASGKVFLGENALTIGAAGSVSGGTATSYIATNGTGSLVRQNVGITAVAFPIGTASSYNPVTVATEQGVDDFAARVLESVSPPSANDNAALQRTWDITEGSPGGNGDITFTVQWNAGEEGSTFDLNRTALAAWKHNGTAWVIDGVLLSVTPAPTYPAVATVVAFEGNLSYWTIANENAALPVSISSFAAQINPGGSGVLLEWTTISEINNYGFYVQRRAEGQTTFTDISNSFTPGAGTTLEPQYYSFLDTTLTSTGTYHYRLRQVDLDGSVHYSHAISIEVLTLGVEEGIPHEFRVFQNYPNPFNPVTTITFSVEKAERTAAILYDILGQEIARIYDEFAEPGRYYNVKVDASAMGSGVYFYRVVTETRSETRKMLLLR